jgi:hypothetical protein
MSTDTPRVRTSDAERERIAETLRSAVGEGRLTLEEGDERLANLYTTKYRDELAPLVSDLPPTEDPNRRSGRGRGRWAADDVWTPDSGVDENGNPRGQGGYGPPWAGPGWSGPGAAGPNPGAGGPAWGPGYHRPPHPPWFVFPLFPLLFAFFIFMAIGGILNGHVFVLIPLLFLTFALVRIAGFRRRWGGWRR